MRASLLVCSTAGLTLSLLLLAPSPVLARRFFRARFEPDTLELQKPGVFSVDAQVGAIGGEGDRDGDGLGANRLLLPDFEVELGLLSWLELDVDGAFFLLDPGAEKERMIGDPLWTAARFELLNVGDKVGGETFGIDLGLGPRWPTLHGAPGVGFAALALIGGGTRRLHGVVNLGTQLDREQPAALLYGLDLGLVADKPGKWSVLGQVAGAFVLGHGQHQLLTNVGVSYEISEALELSVLGITGPAYRGDRLGILAGLTSDFSIW